MTSGPAKSENWPVLGGLRFFLALVVVACHIDFVPDARWNLLKPLQQLGGTASVFAFLLVSGYSICHSISANPEGFYNRRIARIMPTFLAGFALSLLPFVIDAFHPETAHNIPPDTAAALAINAIPVQGFLVKSFNTNPVTWSLGVEVLFYALAPWFARCPRRGIWSLVAVSLALHAGSGWLGVSEYSGTVSPLVPACVAWAWLLGWAIYKERENALVQAFAVGLSMIGFGLSPMGSIHSPQFAPVVVGATASLLLLQGSIALPARASRICSYVGEISYPLYLLHVPAMLTLATLCPGFAFAPAFLAVAFAASVAVYHGVGLPSRARASASRGRKVVPAPLGAVALSAALK